MNKLINNRYRGKKRVIQSFLDSTDSYQAKIVPNLFDTLKIQELVLDYLENAE